MVFPHNFANKKLSSSFPKQKRKKRLCKSQTEACMDVWVQHTLEHYDRENCGKWTGESEKRVGETSRDQWHITIKTTERWRNWSELLAETERGEGGRRQRPTCIELSDTSNDTRNKWFIICSQTSPNRKADFPIKIVAASIDHRTSSPHRNKGDNDNDRDEKFTRVLITD